VHLRFSFAAYLPDRAGIERITRPYPGRWLWRLSRGKAGFGSPPASRRATLGASHWFHRKIRHGITRQRPSVGDCGASYGQPSVGPQSADHLLTRGLRLDPLASTGGPDEHLPSTARIHRCARQLSNVAARGDEHGGLARSKIRLVRSGDLGVRSRVPLNVFGTDEFPPFVQGAPVVQGAPER